MSRSPRSPIVALGCSPEQERLYLDLTPQSGRDVDSVAQVLLRQPAELLEEIAPLVTAGLVRLAHDRLFVVAPREAIAGQIGWAAGAVNDVQSKLNELARALTALDEGSYGPRPGEVRDVESIDGELSAGGQTIGLLITLISMTTGDLLWLRPDQWRAPDEDPLAGVIAEVVASGRASRAIYPIRATTEAPETLRHRAEIGEQIRVLPEIPTRMLVLGRTHLILPEPLGMHAEPRTLVRQAGLVAASTLWFEELWARASPIPELVLDSSGPDLRRFLLQQLAAGAQDEMIARRLGISLRTVRRRVAEILSELGADSRFQAGVEAARRGWL